MLTLTKETSKFLVVYTDGKGEEASVLFGSEKRERALKFIRNFRAIRFALFGKVSDSNYQFLTYVVTE